MVIRRPRWHLGADRRTSNRARYWNWPTSPSAASNLTRTLRNLERYGLVKLHRSPDTRAVRPEALATEFLVVLE